MSYLVFARKFRPRSFTEVTGQESAVTTLRNALGSGRIAHAFCFAGPRGVGKTTTARLLAKALNCAEGPTADPCGKCDSCLEVSDGGAMDVLEIDGASNRGVEDVKSLRESIQYTPARDRYKVVIIDEVHMLSVHAFNALLKTLEEPPAHVKFIFATTELHKVPATILSRCQVYEFRRIGFQPMVARLRRICEAEKLAATDEALALIARNSEGCMRDAESMLDQVVAFGGEQLTPELVTDVLGLIATDVLFDLTDALLAEDSPEILMLIDRVVDGGTDPRQFATHFGEHLRNLLVARVAKDPKSVIMAGEQHLQRLAEQCVKATEEEWLRLLGLLATAEEPLRRTSGPRFLLETTLLKMVQARRLTPLVDILGALGVADPNPARATPEPKRSAAKATAIPAPESAPAPESEPEASPTRPAPAPTPPSTPAQEPVRATPAEPPTPNPAATTPEPARAAAPGAPAPVPLPDSFPTTPPASDPAALPLETESTQPPRKVRRQRTLDTTPRTQEPTKPAPPAPASTRRSEAEEDPTVARFRDLFKAEIVQVDDPS